MAAALTTRREPVNAGACGAANEKGRPGWSGLDRQFHQEKMVGTTRIELVTPAMSTAGFDK
jgi:hypothetical protein